MPEGSWLLIAVILFTLAFEFTNGMHDTANAIATVVSTRVLGAGTAILMAAGLNFTGALVSTEVAKTISSGLLASGSATSLVVLSAVLAATAWNLTTWRLGLPSSSSHALIGGLCGAAMTHAGAKAVLWGAIVKKVVLPMVLSPLAGFVVAFFLMLLIVTLLAHVRRTWPERVFKRLQLLSAGMMAFAHGQSDAQKGMGIITLALASAGLVSSHRIPAWVMLACAAAMGIGTAIGGWRIIKTMGHKIIRLEPVHGFAAESSCATIIAIASHFGMPVSTTQVVSGCIFGVGASKRLGAVRWGVAQDMAAAWVMTFPAAGAVGALTYAVSRGFATG